MHMQKGPNMRNGDFVENERIRKCPKLDFLIKKDPTGGPRGAK